MEELSGKGRIEVLHQPISAVLPPEFVARFNSVREEHGHAYALQVPPGAAPAEASGLRTSPLRRW